MDRASWLGQCLWVHANTIPDRHSEHQAGVNPGRSSGDGDLPKATARLTRTYRHAGIAGIQPAHAGRLRLQLAALDQSVRPEDMSAPAWGLHPLKGGLKGHWAVTANGNWRMVFTFEGTDAVLVDYLDYH